MFAKPLLDDGRDLLEILVTKGLMLATAESCTGGLVMALLTAISGSSRAVDRGFVTYSNEAKQEMLGVSPQLIRDHGAVSGPVAHAMAEGALQMSRAGIAVSVTGVAGPDGGTSEKPVGLVHFACAYRGHETLHVAHRFGDLGRDAIRIAAVGESLKLVRRQLEA